MSAPEKRQGQREQEIFFQALDKHTPEERAAFLDGACANEPGLRRRVDALLVHHFDRANFMRAMACGLEKASEGAGGNGLTTVLAVAADEAIGGTIGRYKLRERLGEGGCGIVYVAEQSEPVRRRVALKVIKLGMDTREVIARFGAERQALAMMDHPNVAKVFDAGTTETGRPYFVMELVRGIRITDYCDQANLSTGDRLELFIKVCQAIHHAHEKGIIHRDIKPSNILVTLHDGVPVPKVIDFGIAKATEGRLTDATVYTQLHQFLGTPAYMSPEQAEMSGLEIDTRSDIYSLGVLLYHMTLSPGDRLRTGPKSRATVRGGDLSVMRINENTVMRMASPSTTTTGNPALQLDKGALHFINPGKTNSPRITTPQSGAQIRG